MRSASATEVPPNFWTTRRAEEDATEPGYQRRSTAFEAIPRGKGWCATGDAGRLASPPVPTEKRLRKREGRQARLEEMRRAQQQARQRRLLIYGAIAVIIVVGLSYLVSRG